MIGYEQPALLGMHRLDLCVIAIEVDGATNYHAYTDGFYGHSDWRLSTAIQNIDIISEENMYLFETKSGSTYAVVGYKQLEDDHPMLAYACNWFYNGKGAKARPMSVEELKNIPGANYE